MWWKKLKDLWWEGEGKRQPNESLKRYYDTKYNIAKEISPSVICEIGVRAGYSAFAFLSAAPNAKFLGIDIDNGSHGGVKGITKEYAHVVLDGFDYKLLIANSQQMESLPVDADFVHVDGDHTYKGCMHDLEISRDHAEWILVDDYDFLKKVKMAVGDFLKNNPDCTGKHIPDGRRGNMLIHTPFRRKRSN